MSEESSENKIKLMIDMDEECVFHGENNTIEKPIAIAAYADIDELNNENYQNSEKRKNISIPENGIIEIDRSNLKENNFYFVLQSKIWIANFIKMANVKFDTNKNFYYMKFDKNIAPIQFEDNSIIKGFESEENLIFFKKQQDEEKAKQAKATPAQQPEPEQPPQTEQTEPQTEQPVEPAPEQPPEQPAEQKAEQEAQNDLTEQQPEATDSNDSNQEKDANSQKTNNKSSKSKWIFMIAGGLLVVAGIAMSFLTFGFGVIPFGTTIAALSVAIPSVLGTALVTGASTQFAKRKMSKIAIAAIALGAALTLSTILLSVFTFGLGAAALGTVTAGFAIGIPAAIGVGAITVGSIIYDGQKKKYGDFEKLSEFSEDLNTATVFLDNNGKKPAQENRTEKVVDLTPGNN